MNFFNTHINESAIEHISEVLTSSRLSEGEKVKIFEGKLQDLIKSNYMLAVNSGTSALHLALILGGVDQGDEVILPAQTFVATGLSILYLKAIPVFVDINLNTGNLCGNDLQKKISKKTKAIIPVHWGGIPCDMDKINEIAQFHGVTVIEDAAHALGSTYKGKTIGSISSFTCFSFQAIKSLTTGDGGAISILDIDKYKEGYRRRWFGMDRSDVSKTDFGERIGDISELGYKYHLNDFAAALGIANLKDFHENLSKRKRTALLYDSILKDKNTIEVLGSASYQYHSSYWLYGIRTKDRAGLFKKLTNKGIPCSTVHTGIDKYSIFKKFKTNLPNQRIFDDTQLNIPIHEGLNDNDIDLIANLLKTIE